MSKWKTLAVSAAMAVAVLGSAVSPALAAAEINVAPGRTLKGPGVAVHGFDPVAYFTQKKAIQGTATYSVVHGAATYRFANAAHMRTFKANPEKYVPAFGGFCAYGVSVGAKFDGDPRYWRIVDGKLYLNLNREIQKTWLKDIPGNIKKAVKSWTKIKRKDPASLS